MNNEQNNNTQQENNKPVEPIQASSPEKNSSDTMNKAKSFFNTPTGKIITYVGIGLVVILLVAAKIGGRSHNISKHASGVFGSSSSSKVESKKVHNDILSGLKKECKLMNIPINKKNNGMECVSTTVSDDNKSIQLTLRFLDAEIAQNVVGQEDAIKENICNTNKAKFNKLLKFIDSIEYIYLTPDNKTAADVKITKC